MSDVAGAGRGTSQKASEAGIMSDYQTCACSAQECREHGCQLVKARAELAAAKEESSKRLDAVVSLDTDNPKLRTKCRELLAELATERERAVIAEGRLGLQIEKSNRLNNSLVDTEKSRDEARAELAAERERAERLETDRREAVENVEAIAAERDEARAELIKADQIITSYDAASVQIGAALHTAITRADALRAELDAAIQRAERAEMSARSWEQQAKLKY